MKKFLAALLIVGSLFFATTTVEAAIDNLIEIFNGAGSATMREAENQEQVIERAKAYALRDAQEQAGDYIKNQSRNNNLKLNDSEIDTLAKSLVEIVNATIRKSMTNDGLIQVFVTVKVQIDTEALQREIEQLLNKRKLVEKPKPTTPIERPKPIETPAPSNTIKTYVGMDDYTVGQRETQEEAENHSKLRAMRNACEQAGVFIRSQSRSKDLELVEDEIISVAETIAKIVGKPEYKTEVLSDGRSTVIHTKVTVQIDTDDLERRLEEFARRHKR